MKAVIALLLMSIAGVAVCEDIKTLDHKVYKNATITRTEPDGIVIQYSAGIVKIPFTDLPEEFSKRYDYDPEEAKTFKADIEQKQAQIYLETQAEKARQEESREAEQQIKQNEKRMAADEAERRATIEQTIAVHSLVIGMTPDQVVKSRGKPDKINRTTTANGEEEQWVYGWRQYWVSSQAASIGTLTTINEKVPEGWRYIPPCYIYFENGILTAIQDQP